MLDIEIITNKVDNIVINNIVDVERNSFPIGWTYADAKDYFNDLIINKDNLRILLKDGRKIVGFLFSIPHNLAKQDLMNDDPEITEDDSRYYIETTAINPPYQRKFGFYKLIKSFLNELKMKEIRKISMHARVLNHKLSEDIQNSKRINVTLIRRINFWKYYNNEEPIDYIEADLI